LTESVVYATNDSRHEAVGDKTMLTAVQRCNAAFKNSFMKPYIMKGKDDQLTIMEAGLDLEDDGYYVRLSAAGYLDCTDWSGPYATVEEGAQALLDLYGDES
jgi:hypothetical protein